MARAAVVLLYMWLLSPCMDSLPRVIALRGFQAKTALVSSVLELVSITCFALLCV